MEAQRAAAAEQQRKFSNFSSKFLVGAVVFSRGNQAKPRRNRCFVNMETGQQQERAQQERARADAQEEQMRTFFQVFSQINKIAEKCRLLVA